MTKTLQITWGIAQIIKKKQKATKIYSDLKKQTEKHRIWVKFGDVSERGIIDSVGWV